MKSLTIHNLDPELYEAIRMRSKKNRRSMNQEIKEILHKQLINKQDKNDNFKRFLGIWSDKDLSDFNNRTSDTRKIIQGDWD
jgi:plasmid stability protein